MVTSCWMMLATWFTLTTDSSCPAHQRWSTEIHSTLNSTLYFSESWVWEFTLQADTRVCWGMKILITWQDQDLPWNTIRSWVVLEGTCLNISKFSSCKVVLKMKRNSQNYWWWHNRSCGCQETPGQVHQSGWYNEGWVPGILGIYQVQHAMHGVDQSSIAQNLI